jgi:hypothetical protein
VTPEVPFRFDVSLIDTAPGSAKKQIRDVPGIQPLPLGDLGRRFVLLRAADQGGTNWSQLFENLLFEDWTHIHSGREISFSTGESALAAHMDEIGEGLSSSGSLMKISPFPAECIRRDHALRLELVVTHGTTKVDLTQRCHGWPPLSSELRRNEREYLCHNFQNFFFGGISALLRLWVDCIFSHRKNRDRLPTPATWSLMLINLLPDFFAVHNSTDRVAAYLRYFENHRRFLEAYWHNYVLDPAGPHFLEVVRSAALASRVDLRTMLERIDVVSLARNTEEQCRALLNVDTDIDVVLMVGVGAANAGELVVDGKGIAFVCLEHFTSITNPETQGLGLDPELIPLWLAHEIAHTVRYTSPTSRSELRQLIEDAGGYYSYWETGRRASLRELMLNEGLATHASRIISPGHAAWEYYGYTRREYASVRELEPLMTRSLTADLDRAGLGLRLRYLSGGMSDDARTVDRHIFPERAGYFLGARMVEAAVNARGLSWAIRASAGEITSIASSAAASA